MKIMRAWDKGNSKVAFVYRDKETGRKKIGERKFDWWFYVKTSDYEHYKNQFKSFENQNLIMRCEPEGLYTRVYVERPHRTELFNTEMEFVWEHKNFLFNELQQKLELLSVQTYEADVLPYKRFCLQDDIEFEDKHKLLFLDIETDDRHRNGQPVPGEYRILSVALGEMNSKIAWLCIDEDTDEAEKSMLLKLAKIMNSYDVLIGWNSSSFDLPYIKSRFMRYGISIDWRKLFSQDFMKIFQKTVSLRSYALDAVAKELELEGKVEHSDYSIYRMWKDNRPLLKKYNIQDVNIMIEMEKKTNYLNAARNVNIIGMCPCDDPYITRKIDNLMLKQAQEDKHFHFKTMVKNYGEIDVDDVSYEGAYVFPPKAGIYYGIKVFDFSSLYPNTIKTLNISPDTLIRHGDNIDEKFIITTPTPAKHKFRKDFIGILPKVIMKMKKNRDYYKDLMAKEEPGSVMHKTYDTLQYVYKSFGLSFYGALGEKHTRFYDVRIAESVTLGGQYFNKTCAAWLEKQGKVIVYGDSVTKNRRTIIKIDNEISVVSFEELYNMCDKFTHQRGKEFGEFKNNEVFTLSYNFNTKESEWKRINVVIKHKTNKKIYRIVGCGYSTEVTEDHSLINSSGNCFKATECDVNSPFLVFETYTKNGNKPTITEIEYDGYVYDLSVEDNNNFVDADGHVLLHNTDSVFVEKITPEQIDKIIKYLAKLCEIHAKQKFNCDECTLEMAYDKGFHKFIICNAKKRYAGYLNYLDGHIIEPMKLKITGFEYVRNDVCYFVKKYQKEFLTWLLNDKTPDLLEVRDWVINKRTDVMCGKLIADDLMFSKKITKPLSEYVTELPQVKVAKQMIKDGKDFWIGDKVQYFFLTFDSKKKPVPLPIYHYNGTYNSSYYWNNCIFPAFERILVVAFPSVKWDEYYILDKNKTGSLKLGRNLWS